MKNFLIIIMLIISANIFGEKLIISTDVELVNRINAIAPVAKTLNQFSSTAILEVDEANIDVLIKAAHEAGRCGGFFIHDTELEAVNSVTASVSKSSPIKYNIINIPFIHSLVSNVKEPMILDFIKELSALHTRYYKSKTGVEASMIIKEKWSTYTDTELYKHKKWAQPSVIATIIGSKYPDEVIIIGGHLDSIGGIFGSKRARSPGADDNASGMATVTEVLRVLSSTNYKPLRTIKFMGYAAEEVGLRGSAEIAKSFKKKKIKVIGVMQLDMTNFKGSDKTIYLTTDYTDASQTEFLEGLIGTYLKVPYAKTKCGYACSDHASWTKAGFPAVFPFEAGKGEMNKKIHTKHDTLAVSGGTALHATNFARLALAYLVELDSQSLNVGL